jgi:aminoglycoside phosphotransferase family enzyme/predicted kinase
MDLTPCFPNSQRIDTHISTVWLVGDWAYKLKKPVQFGFLDFSTLALRHHFLQEELRLNQRTAPELYVDLLPITGTAEHPVLAGDGAPIEWVLRMRRFPADAVLSAQAEQGTLSLATIQHLAEHVAFFHAALPPLSSSAWPTKDLCYWTLDALQGIEQALPELPMPTVSELHVQRQIWLDWHAQHVGWLQQRQEQGYCREGHGDLHLGNVVEWQGRVLAFDALEFEPALRCIDLMNDVAFTFMDLLARRHPDWAWYFLNAYLEHSGDFGGVRGLRAFATYRAWVRARVALLSQDAAAFFTYWQLAKDLLQPMTQPHLIVVMGLSGAGKSTLAGLLAQRLGAVRLRSDVERKRLYGLQPTQRPTAEMGLYSREATQRTYQRLNDVAHDLLSWGQTVIVDAACLRHSERVALQQVAKTCQADFHLLECVAPLEQMQQRLQTRQAADSDASDAGLSTLQQQQIWAEPIPDHWAVWHHVMSNVAGIVELEQQVLDWLKTTQR